jgi:hypothetical protein
MVSCNMVVEKHNPHEGARRVYRVYLSGVRCLRVVEGMIWRPFHQACGCGSSIPAAEGHFGDLQLQSLAHPKFRERSRAGSSVTTVSCNLAFFSSLHTLQ